MQATGGLFRLLVMTIGLIVYGSFYPWRFDFGAASPLLNWPGAFDRFILRDVIVNLAIYVPLGLFAFLWFKERAGNAVAGLAAVACGIALSSGIECVQVFIPGRVSSLLDVACNGLGTFVGVGVASLYRETLRLVLARAATTSLLHPSRSLLIVYAWAGFQLYPYFPALSVGMVRWKLSAIAADPVLKWDIMLLALGEWLAVARLLEPIFGQRGLRLALPLLVLLVPAKLLIWGRTFEVSELAGAVAAALIWVLVLHRASWRTSAALGALCLGVLVSGLEPFQFMRTGASFSFVPFGGLLGASWKSALLILLHKTFWYGAMLILLREMGVAAWRAVGAVALFLLAIEIAQIYLPTHFAEITDPLYAALLGLVLLGPTALVSSREKAGRDQGSSSVSQ